MLDPNVATLCREYDIAIVARNRYPEPGQTRAPETMARIIRRHGEGHMRLVLTTLRETANNHVLLDETGMWAASDMIRAWPSVVETKAGEWLQLWDSMPVGPLQHTAQQLAGVVPVRYALGGMLHERINRRFGADRDQTDLFDDRRRPA